MLNIADVEERWIALSLVPTVGQSRGIFEIIFVVVIPACIFILPVPVILLVQFVSMNA